MRTARNKTRVLYDGREDTLAIGRGVVHRDGNDVAIIACGVLVAKALEAAEILFSEGIEASVVDMHTLKPLDEELVAKLVSECGCVVTAEDHSVIGGLGGAVAEFLVTNHPAPLEMVGVNDRFGESGEAEEMRALADSCPVPVLVLGGAAMNDDEALASFTRNALDNGARGVIFGRNAWQRENATAGIEQLIEIVHGT